MKDPAFLFYSGDFKSATELMTDEEVGIYIRLICTLSHTESVFGIYNHTYNVYKCECGYVSSLIEDDELEISNINDK